jgi:hypothetical protein
MPTPPTARNKLDKLGIDQLCIELNEAKSLTSVAKAHGMSPGSLLTWIEADPERSARVRDTRAAMARYWDEKAESDIADSTDDFALKKAKELAYHYRWRAAKIAPRDYGDKITQEHTGPEGGPIKYQNMAPADLDAEIARLSALVGKS